MRIPLDVVGDIAILKFNKWTSILYKKYYGWKMLRNNKNIKVVLEKTSGFSGDLRIQTTRWIVGEKRKNTIHKENNCEFFLDIDKTYFSPRMSQDRKIMAEEILKKIKQNSAVLVMFSGISPFPVVLAKYLKKNKINATIFSSELNKDACRYGEKNIKINKVDNYVKIYCGDSKKLCDSFSRKKIKFDFIIMLRPNLKNTFLDSALKVSRKGTTIYYHGFGTKESVEDEIKKEFKSSSKKINNLLFRKAGDISVKNNRWSVSFSIN